MKAECVSVCEDLRVIFVIPESIQPIIDRISNSNEILAVFIAAILSALGWIGVRTYTGRSKIAWAFSHQHAFNLQNLTPPVLAYTNEIWVQNVGRVVAEEVEIILGAKPQHYDVWPQRHFSELFNPDGSLVIKLDHLNSREHVTISMFQTATQPPMLTNVRWKGGVGKRVPMGPRQIFPRWFSLFLQCLILLGFFSFWYFLFRFI